jgi:hypothetical protein
MVSRPPLQSSEPDYRKLFLPICAWLFITAVFCSSIGCSSNHDPPPPVITQEQREAVATKLVSLGAELTGEYDDTIYLKLRKTHIQLGKLGGSVESTGVTREDVQDTLTATRAVASAFLDDSKMDAFESWLAHPDAAARDPVRRVEFEHLKVTMSRRPLRVVFSQKDGDT